MWSVTVGSTWKWLFNSYFYTLFVADWPCCGCGLPTAGSVCKLDVCHLQSISGGYRLASFTISASSCLYWVPPELLMNTALNFSLPNKPHFILCSFCSRSPRSWQHIPPVVCHISPLTVPHQFPWWPITGYTFLPANIRLSLSHCLDSCYKMLHYIASVAQKSPHPHFFGILCAASATCGANYSETLSRQERWQLANEDLITSGGMGSCKCNEANCHDNEGGGWWH